MTSPAPGTSPAHVASPAHVTGPHVTGRLSGMSGLTPIADTVAHADPQAVYRRLRAEWGEVAPVELEPGVNAWLVMGYQELCQVLRQERIFRRSPAHWLDYTEGRIKPDSTLGPMMFPRPNALFAEGDEHRRLRAPLDDAGKVFPPRQTARLTSEVCGALIESFADRGQADLLAEYAMMIPTIVMGRMLGLDLSTARELCLAAIDMVADGESSRAGSERFAEILTGLVYARKAEPADDMTTVIAKHPNLHDDSERIQTMVLMVSAAAEATMAWTGSTLLLMLTDPRFSGRLRGGRLGIDDALEEVLWRDPAMANFPARFAVRDTRLGGQRIGQGDALILGFAAANADPRVHSDDPWNELGNRSHLAWGAGPHMCPAQVPARVIVRTAVETALHQLPGVRLTVAAGEVGRIGAPWTRCPATLPVTFMPFKPTRLHTRA